MNFPKSFPCMSPWKENPPLSSPEDTWCAERRAKHKKGEKTQLSPTPNCYHSDLDTAGPERNFPPTNLSDIGKRKIRMELKLKQQREGSLSQLDLDQHWARPSLMRNTVHQHTALIHNMISPGCTNSSSITGGCVILLDGELENNQFQTCRENHQVEHGHFAFYVFWSWLLEPSENFLGGLRIATVLTAKAVVLKEHRLDWRTCLPLAATILTLEQLISEVWLLPAPNDVNGGHTSEVPSEFQRDGQCFPCLEFPVDHELLCPGLKVWRLCEKFHESTYITIESPVVIFKLAHENICWAFDMKSFQK